MLDVRDVLASELKERCFMQIAIAKKANLTEQQLCDIIKKRRKLEANEMFRLCKAMGITPNDLFELSEDSA